MTASERSNSPLSIESNAEASKGPVNHYSTDYIAEVLKDVFDETTKTFPSPPVMTSNISYFGSLPYREHELGLSSNPLEKLLKLAEQDMQARVPSICLVENISPDYIAVLGLAWNIHSAFFINHGISGRTDVPLAQSKNSKEGNRIEKDGVNMEGVLVLNLWGSELDEESDTFPLDWTTHYFPRSYSLINPKCIQARTCISYCRVRENLCRSCHAYP